MEEDDLCIVSGWAESDPGACSNIARPEAKINTDKCAKSHDRLDRNCCQDFCAISKDEKATLE